MAKNRKPMKISQTWHNKTTTSHRNIDNNPTISPLHSCTLLQMPQLYYHPQNPSFATDSAKKVRKNRIVAPKRVQMKAPFYILLALALLILQACDIDAAQEEYAAWVTIMLIFWDWWEMGKGQNSFYLRLSHNVELRYVKLFCLRDVNIIEHIWCIW